uniref:Uncharacterized protein n=1 Tax=Cacopsylla melanoneura TaxID=428564 RepID=A0A8D8R656_9HEMI
MENSTNEANLMYAIRSLVFSLSGLLWLSTQFVQYWWRCLRQHCYFRSRRDSCYRYEYPNLAQNGKTKTSLSYNNGGRCSMSHDTSFSSRKLDDYFSSNVGQVCHIFSKRSHASLHCRTVSNQNEKLGCRGFQCTGRSGAYSNTLLVAYGVLERPFPNGSAGSYRNCWRTIRITVTRYYRIIRYYLN